MTSLVSLLLSLGLLALAGLGCRRQPRLWLALTLAASLSLLMACIPVLATGEPLNLRLNLPLTEASLKLSLDALSAWFLVLSAVVGAAGAVYANGYWPDREHPVSAPAGRFLWNGSLLCINLVLLCGNGLFFLFFWELFTLGNYFLLTLDKRSQEVRRAGMLYLVASHAGTLALFAFFSVLRKGTGSWELGPSLADAGLSQVLWLALLGFGLKAGLFPLHIWLPSAHANAPSHVSALMSGLSLKLGVYAILRFCSWLDTPVWAGWLLLSLGCLSCLMGILFALAQGDLKRLLAYSSVENIGLIFIGVGLAILGLRHEAHGVALAALCASLLHTWNHGLFKSLLFLCAGSVLHSSRTRQISELGGLWKAMPWTTLCFALGSLAVCALPPLNGVVGEWLLAQACVGGIALRSPIAYAAIPALLCLAMAGALALATFTKAACLGFLGAPRSKAAERAHEATPSMLAAMLTLCVLCILSGAGSALLWTPLTHAIAAWNPALTSSPVIASGIHTSLQALCLALLAVLLLFVFAGRVLTSKLRTLPAGTSPTWDCGYAQPTARMQYTAASFSDLPTRWFHRLLRPEQHYKAPEGLLASNCIHEERVPEVVLEQVVSPLGGLIMKLSAAVRRLQHGQLQSYLLYVVGAIVALAGLIFFGTT